MDPNCLVARAQQVSLSDRRARLWRTGSAQDRRLTRKVLPLHSDCLGTKSLLRNSFPLDTSWHCFIKWFFWERPSHWEMVDHSGQPMFLEVEKYFVGDSPSLMEHCSLLKDAHLRGVMLAKCKMAYDCSLETCTLN